MPSSFKNENFFNQRAFISPLATIILIIGIIAGVYLIKESSTFFPKAQESKTQFLSNSEINISQSFPEGVYISLCRNNNTDTAGVWQVQSDSATKANFLYDQKEGRCLDPYPDYLTFTQAVSKGTFLSLCIPGQNQEWVWQVNKSGYTANYLYTQNDEACGKNQNSVQLDNSSPEISPDNTDSPEVLEANSSTYCDNGSKIKWSWQLKNSDHAIVWVYGGSDAIYKGGKNGSTGELTLGFSNGIINQGLYALHLKAANSNGQESEITVVEQLAEDCPTESIKRNTSSINDMGVGINIYDTDVDISDEAIASLGRDTDQVKKIIELSKANGFNPAVVLSVYMADGTSFGIRGSNGGFSNNFTSQLQNFLNHYAPGSQTHPLPQCRDLQSVDKFLACHCGPNLATICNNDGNQAYPGLFLYFYNKLVPSDRKGAMTGYLKDPWLCWWKNGVKVYGNDSAPLCKSNIPH